MKALHLLVSEKKKFEVCLLCSYVQTCDPRGRASLTPGTSYDCTNLVEVLKDVLHAKYQNSTTSNFREKEF